MPCYKGLAVSIHTPEGPLSEHSVQKQSRQSRISTYIPVPPPKASSTGVPEQSGFAVSITLLVPGMRVPYSAPKPTPEDPYPQGKIVGTFPGTLDGRGQNNTRVGPYIPRTTSPNETLAAYIYFDGRTKEEVATLLRRGEETWVNSRWVSVPASEGGGLAEREFIFREVGLERWLNGLDLAGKDKDKVAKIEKRHRKLEKRQRVKREHTDSGDEATQRSDARSNGVLRYNADQNAPVETAMEASQTSDDSDDEPPDAEAAGQIKVALFRVLASGEIKKGEYEATFDAHDEEGEGAEAGDADIEHTAGFAKPKHLDPKTISTQTVTGLDPPDSPYAVFTFFYRGEKQLQKMGILPGVKPQEGPVQTKRKSTDFSKLGPLNRFGTVGFTGYRSKKKDSKGDDDDDDMADSDADEEDTITKRKQDYDDDDDDTVTTRNGATLSPLDASKQRELADGLKRVRSAETLNETHKSPHLTSIDTPSTGTPPSGTSAVAIADSPPNIPASDAAPDLAALNSPFKKHRGSVEGLDAITTTPVTQRAEGPTSNPNHNAQPLPSPVQNALSSSGPAVKASVPAADEDEEL